jgi:hypothetical protein
MGPGILVDPARTRDLAEAEEGDGSAPAAPVAAAPAPVEEAPAAEVEAPEADAAAAE